MILHSLHSARDCNSNGTQYSCYYKNYSIFSHYIYNILGIVNRLEIVKFILRIRLWNPKNNQSAVLIKVKHNSSIQIKKLLICLYAYILIYFDWWNSLLVEIIRRLRRKRMTSFDFILILGRFAISLASSRLMAKRPNIKISKKYQKTCLSAVHVTAVNP